MKNSAYRVAALTAFLILTAQPGFAGKDPEARLRQKADRIHRSVLTLDSHNDTPMWLADTTYNFAEDHRGKRPRNRVDIPGMRTGGLDGAFFAVFTSQGERTEEGNLHAMKEALKLFEAIGKTVDRHSGILEMATTSREAYTINKRGKLAVFIGVENGYPIGNDLKNVEKFYNLGARYITLCHTRNNDLCDSSTDTTEHQGVSPFGYKVIEEMNRLGMMVDVSHVSDKSFYDAIKASKTPVIASHSCARAICNNPRNLDDAMLKALAADGGVIQMCILSSYVKTPVPYPQRDSAQAALRLKYRGFKGLSDEEMNQARKEWYAIEDTYPQELATVSDVVDHIDHIVSVAGIRHVGIGTDFDGGGAVKGCEYASEMGNITLELLRRGYSARQIRMIWSGNLLRVMREVEAYASATK
ncbi:MAG: dipeptidase [Bacteroidales bacterium]|nr:dipeptidase [Bacteroidales bacterium]